MYIHTYAGTGNISVKTSKCNINRLNEATEATMQNKLFFLYFEAFAQKYILVPTCVSPTNHIFMRADMFVGVIFG